MNGLILALDLTRDKLLKAMGNSAMAGCVMDGAVAVIEGKGPGSVVRDMGCGVTTGAAGAAATMLFREHVKKGGPYGLIIGATASVATRYAYRSVFGPKLTDEEEEEDGR